MTHSPLASPAGGGAAGSGGAQTSHAAGAAGEHGVDVQQLADKVYRLLLAEARLGRARGESPMRPGRKGEG